MQMANVFFGREKTWTLNKKQYLLYYEVKNRMKSYSEGALTLNVQAYIVDIKANINQQK